MMTELEYLQGIYDLLINLMPLAHFVTGLLQCCVIGVVVVILYKLFNLFF